jgi:hypothetical protein
MSLSVRDFFARRPRVEQPPAAAGVRRRRKALAGVWLALPWLCACALVDREVTLDYDVAAREPVLQAASAAKVAIGHVEDRRIDPLHVGEVRNGLGMHTADIHAKGDGAEWLQEALAAELGRHGFVVVTDPGEADYVVDAELSHVHCTAMLTYEGDVTLTASAAQFGQRVAGRSYTGKGSAGMNWSATEKAFQATLNLALQDAVLQFVQELPTRAEAVAVVGRGAS